ncbi:MAG: LuxR C-terminal-related transcriptional regulator [Acidobacteriia bacterium]|nr:LuxR C-terminal-related transcriptional regulator [Terriglobia bacterium]
MKTAYFRSILLTARENQILRFIGEGLTSKEIAQRLSISKYTIHAHRRNICSKIREPQRGLKSAPRAISPLAGNHATVLRLTKLLAVRRDALEGIATAFDPHSPPDYFVDAGSFFNAAKSASRVGINCRKAPTCMTRIRSWSIT